MQMQTISTDLTSFWDISDGIIEGLFGRNKLDGISTEWYKGLGFFMTDEHSQSLSCYQEKFEEVMREYPESFKAMDLVAEHRLRALHASDAWQARHASPRSPEVAAKVGQQAEVLFFRDTQVLFIRFQLLN